MTYNIRLDTPVDSINQWPKRMNKVFELIRKYDPDVIGVQEALDHQLKDLLKNLPQYAASGVGRDDGKTKGEYSALLIRKGRFSIKEQSTFWLSETPTIPGSKSWDAAITRVASWIKVYDTKLKKGYFILNTHFDHIGKEARANSARLIKKEVDAQDLTLPIIVTGDFNCERNEEPYSIMTSATGLQLFDSKPANNNQGTFCTFKVHGADCHGIDYIFHSSRWLVDTYSVIDDNDGTYYPSDHLPVMVTLKLKK